MQIFIGIDDTDSLESWGTGRRARQLGELLASSGACRVMSISRHQLLVCDEIPYTSHNSSACIMAEAAGPAIEQIAGLARDFLRRQSAPGSDAGLCIASREAVIDEVHEFGLIAKREVTVQTRARKLARKARMLLEGLTGDEGGVIGALAAVGLRAAGNDGRFLWLPGLRELAGSYRCDELAAAGGIESVCGAGGEALPGDTVIEADGWVRPVLRGGKSVLLMERQENGNWRLLPKDEVKRISG